MHVVTSATVGLAKVQKVGDTTVFQRLLSDLHISFGPYTASLPQSPPPVAPRRTLRHAYIMGQSCWLPTKGLPVSANHIESVIRKPNDPVAEFGDLVQIPPKSYPRPFTLKLNF